MSPVTYVCQRPDEALLVLAGVLELVVVLVVAPLVHVVEEAVKPGLGVARVDEGRVLQPAQQLLHVGLDSLVAVVKGAAHYHVYPGIGEE